MPELRIKEFRMPELHLPEMSRDDISRAIGDATRDVDLSRFDPRRVDLPEVAGDISRELSKIDVPKAIADATGKTRSRWPFVAIGAFILGLMAIAVATSPRVRPKLEQAAGEAKRRIDEMRAERELRDQEAHAFDSAVAVPIEPSAFAGDAPATGSPYDGSSELPDGFGADVASETPAEDLVPRA